MGQQESWIENMCWWQRVLIWSTMVSAAGRTWSLIFTPG
jgi:hypothetical protein